MKRREMAKSEVAPAYKSLCHESQPITKMLFGDELPQSICNISQVKRMAVKCIGHDRRKASSSLSPTLISRNLVVEAIPQQIVNVSPFRGSSFSMKNYVDHNTSVGFAFPQSHVGETACERTLSWDFLCLCRLSSYGFYCLPQGSNTDERSTLLLSLNSLCF